MQSEQLKIISALLGVITKQPQGTKQTAIPQKYSGLFFRKRKNLQQK
jgi:hypothetical protein